MKFKPGDKIKVLLNIYNFHHENNIAIVFSCSNTSTGKEIINCIPIGVKGPIFPFFEHEIKLIEPAFVIKTEADYYTWLAKR